jgi:hypothetical protein
VSSLAVAMSACLLSGSLVFAGSAAATPVAVLSDAGIVAISSAGGAATSVAGPDAWQGLAYSGDGTLLATRSDEAENGCDLVNPVSGVVLATPDDVLSVADRSQGLCEISTDPAGGILFEADNGTAGSTASYRLGLGDLAVTPALSGYAASAASDGTVVAVQHRYWTAGGSYEQPWLMTASGRARALATAPKRLGAGLEFTATVISRDGRTVAATAIQGARRYHGVLYAAGAAGRFTTPIWSLSIRKLFVGVQWLPDSDPGLMVGVAASSSASDFALYRTDTRAGHRQRLLDHVRAFAVGPG